MLRHPLLLLFSCFLIFTGPLSGCSELSKYLGEIREISNFRQNQCNIR